jgi:hypothetical protein
VIVRKGGIHEGRGGFQVDHGEFWLFPTRFHQEADELTPDARPLLDEVAKSAPPAGLIDLPGYAVVEHVVHLTDEAQLARLAGLSVLSDRTIRDRFHYRTPGLFVLSVRIFAPDHPRRIIESPHFAGCKSWVDLPDDVATNDLAPVLDDAAHADQMLRIRRALGTSVIV